MPLYEKSFNFFIFSKQFLRIIITYNKFLNEDIWYVTKYQKNRKSQRRI